MGTSRLDRGLRALAWIALALTVAALLAAGAMVQAAPDLELNTAQDDRAGGREE